MQREPPRRAGAGAIASPLTFESKLEREEEVLDALASALARGQLPPEVWTKLHEAAVRDDRVSELAFAYESFAQGRRLKMLAPPVAAEFLFKAATFFADVLGDEFGARNYLERVLAASPAHQAAFERLDILLTKAGDFRRLAETYVTIATHRHRDEQVELLRKGAELVEMAEGGEDRAIEIHQQLLRLDPSDVLSRHTLEEKFLRTNRHRDVARLLEQAFAADPPPTEVEGKAMRARLIELYATQLHEPERTMPHVEALLAVDPGNEDAKRAATKLLGIKGLAARAAAVLADAAEKTETADVVARHLATELEHIRGPRRRDVLVRLGILKQDRLNDPAGAYESFEQALLLDPSEDEHRLRYVVLSLKLSKPLEAARTLSRVATIAKDARVRARISAETGELFAAGGEVRRARTIFVSVLASAAGDPVATLKAARALAEIYAAEKDAKALADVLDKVIESETDADKRARALEQLGELAAATLKDTARAIAAWKELVTGPFRGRALAALEPLYEATGSSTDLAWVLEERAKEATGLEARRLAVRAAEVLTAAGEHERASAAWKWIVDKFGAARDVHARWIPLLEAARRWHDLAHALAADAQLAPEGERAAIWARLGHVRLHKTREVEQAIDAFRLALAVDPAEKTSRASLEKLLAAGEHRLAAAQVLEPVYRGQEQAPATAKTSPASAEASGALLLRVLDVKASLDPEGTSRLAALAEAVTLASRLPEERGRAIELAARGLGEAVTQGAALATWLARVEALAASGADAKRHAGLLAKALGDRPVTSNELSRLARRLGEAQAASGDVPAAIAAYRRALDFEPSSNELLARVDELLRDEGNPAERIALYRAALARGVDPKRRRDLLHAIGALARDELHDARAAIESYETALQDDIDDRDAHAALVDLHAAMGAWDKLADLLESRIARASGAELVAVRAQLAELAATHGQRDRARNHAAALLTYAELPAPALDVVERVADELDDVPLARAVLERRSSEAQDAREQVNWLVRLGILENERARDVTAATLAWKRAAALALSAGEDAVALDLYERVREVVPHDVHSTQRLTELLERAEVWDRLPELYGVLVELAKEPGEAIALLGRTARVQGDKLGDLLAAARTAERAFLLSPSDRDLLAMYERFAVAATDGKRFADVLRQTLSVEGGVATTDPSLRADLEMARGRVMASSPETQADAIAAYRTLLNDDSLDEPRARAALSALEALLDSETALAGDWRWLHSWRVAHASEGERASTVMAWAAVEETRLADPVQALALYREVLTLDPDNVEAMVSIARIALATGDVDGAVAALVARRDRSEGSARSAIDLEMATILLDRGVRRSDALSCVAAVLEAAPSDATALSLSARLLSSDETRVAAIAMLERTLDGVEDAEVRSQVLVRLLDTPVDAASHELRRGWFERLLDLREGRGEIEEALGTIVRAAEEMPTVDPLWERAESLARSANRSDEVAALYARVLGSSLGREQALALGRRAVAFHEEWFEDSERASRILERMVEIDPTDSWAFDRLKLIFDAAERWDDLFLLYDKAIAAASGPRRVELLEDAAQVAKDFANRSERAIGYLEQLLALRPDARLGASLERLYERHGRHRELVWLLYGRIPQLGVREAQAVRARITDVLLSHLADGASALAVVEELISKGDDASIDVPALLERILAVAPANAEVRDSMVPPPEGSERPIRNPASVPPAAKRTLVRQRAAMLLKERYAAVGRDEDLARVLEIELESIRSVRERIRRHRQIADLYSSLGRDSQALDHAVSLVLLEPDVASHRDRLAELAGRVGRFDRLAEVLVTAAEDCTDDALRIDLLMQAGVANVDLLRDDAKAIDLFFRILDVPGHDAAHLAAARRLAPLLQKVERPYERLDVMERIAGLETDAALRRTELARIAELASSLGESERAIAAWQKRLAEAPGDAEALSGLVALLDKAHKWRDLIQVLVQRSETTTSLAERQADRTWAAEILRRELGAIDEAIVAWRAIEVEFEATDESTHALIALLRAAERWEELAGILDRAAKAAVASERADLHWELGDVHRQHLLAPGLAVQAYEACLGVDAHHAGARRGLLAVVAGGDERSHAMDVLLRTYRAGDEWRSIVDLLEPRLSVAAGAGDKIEVLLEAAGILEGRASDYEGTFVVLRRALLLDPSRADVASDLQRLAERTRAWRPLANAYREALEQADTVVPPPAWAIRLRLALGEILDTRLDDPRSALAANAHVLADDPAEPTAARAAIRLAARIGRWDVAARTLVDASSAAGAVDPSLLASVEESLAGPAAWDGLTAALTLVLADRGVVVGTVARDLEARLGEWHRDRRGDPDAAEQAFARALGYAPDDASLLGALAQLQRRTRGRPLVDSLLRLSGATGGDLDLLREAAEVARASVSDRGLAKSIVERVLHMAIDRWVPSGEDAVTISSGNVSRPAAYVEWAIGEMSSIHEEEGDPSRIVDLLLETSRLPFSRDQSRVMRHEAARIAADRIGDIDRAIGVWTGLFEEDPHDVAAVGRLVSALEGPARRLELLGVRQKQVRAASDRGARVAARLEAARLEWALGEIDAAVASLEANLAEDDRHAASVSELLGIQERTGRYADLTLLLERQAQREENANDPRAAADLWARAAEVAEAQLADLDRALADHRRVIALEPRAPSLDALSRILSSRGEWVEAAAHLASLRKSSEGPARADVVLRLAEALTAAGDDAAAKSCLEEAFAQDPAAEHVVARLAERYRQAQEWRALAELLTRSANHAPDKSARLGALREAASLYRERCDAPEEAVPLLEQASDLDPEDRALRLGLADSLGAAKRYGDARNVLRALIDGFGGRRPKDRAPVHYQLARLDLALGDRAQALVELDAAMRIDPANPEILRALAELARDDGQLERAERSYRALLAVLRRNEEPTEETSIVRSEVLVELATLARAQKEPERAAELIESALEVASKNAVEARRMEQALRLREDFASLARALGARAERGGDPLEVAAAMAEQAQVLDAHLGRAAEAFEVLMRALVVAPQVASLHDATATLARRLGTLREYSGRLLELGAAAEGRQDDDTACELALRVGSLYEHDLGNDAEAARHYERAQQFHLRLPDILLALDRVYERLGDDAAQARVLAKRIDVESSGAVATTDALYRLARLKLLKPDSVDEGCDLLVTALRVAPDLARAKEVLEVAAGIHPTSERLIEIYEGVGRMPGEERALVAALSLRAELPGSGPEPLRQAAEVARDLGDRGLAESLLRRLVARVDGEALAGERNGRSSSPGPDPAGRPYLAWALIELGVLREKADDIAEAVGFKRRAAELADGEEARRLNFEVARLAKERLGDLALATTVYEALHAKEPVDRDAWEPLLDVYRLTKAHAVRAELIARVVTFVDDAAERSRLRLERAKLTMNELGAGDAAAPMLREIVDEDPSQVEASILLAEILERSGRDDDLAYLLSQQIDSAKDRNDASSVAGLSMRLGVLVEKRSVADARAVYYGALEWEPANRDCLRALVRLHDGDGDSGDRADAMERLLPLEEPANVEELAMKLADLRSAEGDDDGTRRALELGFRASPASVALRDRLEAAYATSEDWASVASLHETDAQTRSEKGAKVARLREAAGLWREKAGDAARAAEVLKRARAEEQNDVPLLEELVDTLAASGDKAGAVLELSMAIDGFGDENAATPGLLRRRALLRAELGDEEGSLFDLERAFRVGGVAHAPAVIASLEKLVSTAWAAGDSSKWRAMRLRLAEILAITGDADQARLLLADLLKHDAKDRDVLRAAARLEERAEKWDAASATYRRLVAVEDSDHVVETALHLADACERAGRIGDARGGLERARMVAPTHEALTARLLAVYEASGAYRELASLHLEEAKAARDVAGRFAHLLRAGTLLLEHGSDPNLALIPLREANALRPGDLACSAQMAVGLAAVGKAQEATEMLAALLAPHKGRRSRELALVHHAAAHVARAAGDSPAELTWLTSALDMDPQNGAVASELALVAREAGQLELAQRALRVVTMLKAPAPLSRGLAYQYLGEIAQKQGDVKRALMLLKRAVDDDPSLASAKALLSQLKQD
jgi:tetratricopeptide (TPR) repeat protein